MKKVLALIAVVGFVACNNGETKDAKADSMRMADSMKRVDDSMMKMKSMMDTSKAAMDTAKAAMDTAKSKM